MIESETSLGFGAFQNWYGRPHKLPLR